MLRINYHLQTSATIAPDAPTLVLIHGLFGSLDNLAVLRRHFEPHYCVLSIDLPDHGRSEHSQVFSFEEYANSILSTIQSLGLSSVVLVGHSLGGKVSMLIANKAPQLVKQLIILDIAPVAYSPRHHNVIQGLTNLKLGTIQNRQDANQQLANYIKDPSTRAFLLKSLYQDQQHCWHWRFNLDLLVRDYAKLSDWPFSEVLFEGPVLFIKGAQSDYITPEHQAVIRQHFPNAIAKVVNAGHWLHAEKPQTVNALLTKYLPVDEN